MQEDDIAARRVTVSGRGIVRAAPDAATIRVGIEANATSVAEAREAAARRMTGAIDALLARGIARSDLQTDFFRVSLVWDHGSKRQPPAVTGYAVRNELQATIRDLDRLGAVLDDALAAGMNQVSGPTFFVERPQDLEDEARRLAVADARRRAETLADAAGARLGRIVSIDESDRPATVLRHRMFADAAAASAATPIETGMEDIAIGIRATWELH